MKRYGSRCIKAAIAEKGIELSRKTVAKLMQEQGLKAIQPKSFVPKTTDSSHGKRVAENLLLNQEVYPIFRAIKPDQVWVSDITYLPLKSGKWRVPPRLLSNIYRFVHQKDCWLESR